MFFRLELNDIERNILKIEGVKDCTAIAKYNSDGVVKLIKAFVVTDYDQKITKDELSKLIPGYMMPKTIKIIDKLPINKNGKIDRKALAEL